MSQVGHVVHFTNDMQHHIERTKFIWNINYKGILNNEVSIKVDNSIASEVDR